MHDATSYHCCHLTCRLVLLFISRRNFIPEFIMNVQDLFNIIIGQIYDGSIGRAVEGKVSFILATDVLLSSGAQVWIAIICLRLYNFLGFCRFLSNFRVFCRFHNFFLSYAITDKYQKSNKNEFVQSKLHLRLSMSFALPCC